MLKQTPPRELIGYRLTSMAHKIERMLDRVIADPSFNADKKTLKIVAMLSQSYSSLISEAREQKSLR